MSLIHELQKDIQNNVYKNLSDALANFLGKDDLPAIQYLLCNHLDQVDINNDNEQWDCAYYLPFAYARSCDAMKLLIQAKIDTSQNNPSNCSLLTQVVQNHDTKSLQMMINAGIDLNQCEVGNFDEHGQRDYDLYEDDFSNMNSTCVLHISDNHEITKMLLDGKANPNQVNDDLNTPLDVAIAKDDEVKVQLLIDAKADIHMTRIAKYVKYF